VIIVFPHRRGSKKIVAPENLFPVFLIRSPMPLRSFPSPKIERIESVPAKEAPVERLSAPMRSFWRTSLLLATSAALGGIAVAIWNRRTLAQMRQHSDGPPWGE